MDWRGGTRLGDQLERFLDQWGQRGMARAASVVIVSDGWEQGDCVLLSEQMRRLQRLAYRTVWCNPHKASPGFAPIARGMSSVLPYIDDLVGCASFGELKALSLAIAAHR